MNIWNCHAVPQTCLSATVSLKCCIIPNGWKIMAKLMMVETDITKNKV